MEFNNIPSSPSAAEQYGSLFMQDFWDLVDMKGRPFRYQDSLYKYERTDPKEFSQNLADAAQDPDFITLYKNVQHAYKCSAPQNAFSDQLILQTHCFGPPYTVYYDRFFNELGSTGLMLRDKDRFDDMLKNPQDFSGLKWNLSYTPRFRLEPQVELDGISYKRTPYNTIITSAFCLALQSQMYADDYYQTSPDRKKRMIADYKQQEQLVLNCANTYYLFHQTLADMAGIDIEQKVVPEIPLVYPAIVPT